MKLPSNAAQLTPVFFMPTTAALQVVVDASRVPSEAACGRVYVLGIALGKGGKWLWLIGVREFLLGLGIHHMERLGYSFF